MEINFEKPLFVLEMANNHMGSLEHGIRMIQEFARVKKEYHYNFAFKFQLRDIDTFIHPDFMNRDDLNYVKRFKETQLTLENYITFIEALKKHGFISICTGFDEASVDLMAKLDFDIFKIASCSFTDWPLLERIVKENKPVIASTAGSTLNDIDAVISFLQHREKQFAIMHCVGIYPTKASNLQLNQIDLFKKRYPEVPIGFSTHEDPGQTDAIKIAVAKGAQIFEKHVAIETDVFTKNAYSATPAQVAKWIEAAHTALTMCGVHGKRATFSDKEIADLRQFKRGVFAKNKISEGEIIVPSSVFYAFPNCDNQILANDMSKYTEFKAQKNIEVNAPILFNHVEKREKREAVYQIVQKVKDLLNKGNIVFPGKASLEISHHYGLEKFDEFGITMITVVNREYCKKLIAVLPGQKHPEQFHKTKEETFVVLYGQVSLTLDDKTIECSLGDVITVHAGKMHSFSSETGAVIEEISSTHYQDDSYYSDESIMENPSRKTFLSYWID